MSYCQCRLKLVFSSIFKEFGWSHVALILDRSDLFSLTVGKNLEYGLRKEGLLKFVRELDGNSDDEPYHFYLRDASMYARGLYTIKRMNEIFQIFIRDKYVYFCSRDTERTRHSRKEIHAGCTSTRYDERRLDILGRGNLSSMNFHILYHIHFYAAYFICLWLLKIVQKEFILIQEVT